MSIFVNRMFSPHLMLDGTHFRKNILISRQANILQSGRAQRMSCDLSEILERTRPPDHELVDLIEQAFLGGQIDGLRADLAYLCLLPVLGTKAGTFAGTRSN